MSAPQYCPECGAVLPAGAPGGLCPKCLIVAAVARSGTMPGDEPTGAGDDIPMVFEPLPAGAENARPRAPVGLDEFRRAVQELGLIPAFELERFVAAAKGGVPDLARALVRAGKLTPYQAGALVAGQGPGAGDRQLLHPRQAGRRRHGGRLQGPASPARPGRRAEDPAAVAGTRHQTCSRGSAARSTSPPG